MNTDSCDMTPVADIDALYDAPVGSFVFREADDHGELIMMLWMKLPCGGMSAICVNGAKKPGRTVWSWDGNKEKPTLSPSILRRDEWHGFIRAGRMVSC